MSTYGSRPLYSPMSGVSTSSRTSKDADTTADVATPSKLDMTVTGKTASDLIRLQKKRLKGVRKALEEAKRKVKLLSAREKEEEKIYEMVCGIAENDEKLCRLLKKQKKLILVLDLDHTLIHSKSVKKNDKYHDVDAELVEVPLDEGGVKRFWVSLRPFVKEFLQRLAPHFQLHIFTFGGRNYANEMVALLERKCKVSFHTVLTSTEWFNKHTKSIEPIFPQSKTKVLILDDDKDGVWKDTRNLIRVFPYFFFQDKFEQKMGKNENAANGDAPGIRLFQTRSATLSIQHVDRNVDQGLFHVYKKEDYTRAHDKENSRHDVFNNVINVLQQIYSRVYPDTPHTIESIRGSKKHFSRIPAKFKTPSPSKGKSKKKKKGGSGGGGSSSGGGGGGGGGKRGRTNDSSPGSPMTSDSDSSRSRSSTNSSDDSSSRSSSSSRTSRNTPSTRSRRRRRPRSPSSTDEDSSYYSYSDSETDVRTILSDIRPAHLMHNYSFVVLGGSDKFNKELQQLANSLGANLGFLSSEMSRAPTYLIMSKYSFDFTMATHPTDSIFFITLHNADFEMCHSVYKRACKASSKVKPVALTPISVAWLMDSFMLWSVVPEKEYHLDPHGRVTIQYLPGLLVVTRNAQQLQNT